MADTDIAVVGIGCRLPGAKNPDEFWRLLAEGRSARVEFSDAQLRAAGVSEQAICDPDYVKAGMPLADIDQFDAGFFGLSPRDAAIMDPQHRVFLEVCWEAFEDANIVPDRFAGRVGVFAGCGMDTYLLHNILTNQDLVRSVGMFLIRHTGNDKDFLATRVSYQFDLRGPSVNVLTACSTSLVAIHQASHSLLAGECDLALAGGVTILVPQDRGYRYEDGEILSPDGRCRAFDADSKGTVFGSGAGVVVLRRLADAQRDGDRVLAVVAGSAVNNDGGRKVGYLAPSVDGYAEVVAEAQALADVTADAVQYIEAHGTGTPVGDPIEIEALRQAFRVSTQRRQFCGIGSVKSNLGHLDAAAGVAGFLKVVLALQHERIPASLFFRAPNPRIDFAASPFRVVADAQPWPRGTVPRIAGVSALGVGGTNAHLIVKEAPLPSDLAAEAPPYPRRMHLLPVAAKSEAGVAAAAARLAAHLDGMDDGALPDLAFTLQTARKDFAVRGCAVGATRQELAAALRDPELPARVRKASARAGRLVFLFPGGGAQHPGMGRELYAHETAFRAGADQCLAALPRELAAELRDVLYGARASAGHAALLERPSRALPALFATEYATARALEALGVEPDAMLGHSMGEYVVACLCGVFTPEQAMAVVLLRGQLFEEVQKGAMLTVPLAAEELLELREPGAGGGPELSLAAANAPQLSAVAGTAESIARLEQRLLARGVDCQRLRIDVAAHSHLLDPILDRFRAGLRAIEPRRATTPFVSNVTGDWLTPERAADPDYWVEHLRHTVRFADCVATVLERGDAAFVEVGPGRALTSLVRLHPKACGSATVNALPHPKESVAADRALLDAVGQLWQLGVAPDWRALHGLADGTARRRVRLPTYPFQRQRHWIDAGRPDGKNDGGNDDGADNGTDALLPQRLPTSEWLLQPEWRAQELPAMAPALACTRWLVLGDGQGLARAAADAVRAAGAAAVELAATGDGDADAAQLRDALARAVAGGTLTHVLSLATLDGGDAFAHAHRLLALLQALGRADAARGVRLLAVTRGAARTGGELLPHPEQAVAHGFLRVAVREFDGLQARCVDLDANAAASAQATAARLLREACADDAPLGVAFRAGVRLVLRLAPAAADATADARPVPLRDRGVYLITGGLGGIGLELGRHLATTRRARLVLAGRTALPPRAQWQEWRALRRDRTSDVLAAIAAMEAAGAEVEVVAADVATPAGARAAVARAEQRFGALHGVLHAAGVLDDGLIQLRRPAQLDAVLAPKVRGAEQLDAATAHLEPELFVLFSSVSGLASIPGQCDYAAASTFLDAFAHWRAQARPGRTLAVDWGLWRGLGMVDDGRRELRLQAATAPVPALLGERRDRDGEVEFASTWRPETHWPLAEHRLQGGPCLLPGTAHLELLATAARAAAGAAAVQLQLVELLSPLVCADGEARRVYVLARAPSGPVRGGLELLVQSSPGGEDAPAHARATHARARAAAIDADAGRPLDIAAWWRDAVGPPPGNTAGGNRQTERIAFGPRWRGVARAGYGAGTVTAELHLPASFADDVRRHALHPALVDMALGASIPLLPPRSGELFAPVACEAVIAPGPLPPRIVVHARVRAIEAEARLATLDLQFATANGTPLLELRGLTLFGVARDFGLAPSAPARTAAAPKPAAPALPPALTPAPPPRVRALLEHGIAPAEGFPLLERALALPLPQALITPFEVERAARWLGEPIAIARPAAVAATPPPAAANAMPRDDVERALAALFAELLGVPHPGLDQDFFDLGGHSLLAVRLFARVHRQWGLDLELATLMQAGTVRRLAAIVRAHQKLPEPGSEPARSVPARRGQHLVPIQLQDATGAGRPNLFLVHGAGGNVLGFRDLAHYLGSDQPVFGLQARGVDGRQKPHGSIAEMARDYLAEVREVQPRGPYFLGGYSGGGCVAYEMARQLRQQGEPVAFVGMIDTPSPHMRERSVLARGLIHLRRLLRRGPRYPFRLLRDKVEARRVHRRREALRAAGAALPQELRGAEMQHSFDAAFFRYVVEPYDGRVWLFRAERESRTRFVRDRALGWTRGPQGGVETIDCPGDHFSMCTEPNVQVLCAKLRTAIDGALEALPH
jgi:acyl transferase domain-containing protein/thioesterase domain-containing protein